MAQEEGELVQRTMQWREVAEGMEGSRAEVEWREVKRRVEEREQRWR